MFELKTLTDYSDESLLAELRRVASMVHGARLSEEKFNGLSRVHSATLRRRFGSFTKAISLAGIVQDIPPNLKQTTREEIIQAIQAYAEEFPGEPVIIEEIAKRVGIHQATIRRKFGKWAILLNDIGMKPVPSGRRYTDEECFENIVNLWTHYGRQPSFEELNQAPSSVGAATYKRRWRGWRAALAAFIGYVNQRPQDSEDSRVEPTQKPNMQDDTVDLSALLPSSSRSINLALRYKILVRDKFKCTICGRSPAKDPTVEIHVDHIFPWSKGGTNSPDNLRVLCSDCNLGKGTHIEA